ncbi:zinc finger FYVE domain-containing protein 21-like isoform X2 [Haliotis rufescens]|uniref:zinc finger FYVE domain-containing protein 21-like isoform X2 n=1 Tax=Haliotis rufescens TaxID=6454 RepID=UPI001EAF98E7|nr:zinc finger FYVE domain-containing protein 21-like isoform X2 [Haliotis rufescens]
MAATGEKKLVRSQSGLRMVCMNANDTSPFTLPEPQWIPDADMGYCMNRNCQAKFDFMKRRHHCRRCGKVYCNTCCDKKLPLPRMCFVDPVRHCNNCYENTLKENEFYDKHLKTLLTGGEFLMLDQDENSDSSESFLCKLSSNNRLLTFEGENRKRESILVDRIEAVQVVTTDIDTQGNKMGTGIALRYKDNYGDSQTVKMEVIDGSSSKKQGMTWVAAMQKAFKMIFESRTDSSYP